MPPWPWKYGDHARALDALLQFHPKAVVVDILFVDSRPDDTLPDLVAEIGRYKKAHVPIYFEGGIDLPFGEIRCGRRSQPPACRCWIRPCRSTTASARQYNATGRCFGSKPDDGGDLSVAGAACLQGTSIRKWPLEKLNGMMELVWGTRTAPENHWITRTNDDGAKVSCVE